MTLELVAMAGLLWAAAAWGKRVPAQNLVLAAGLISVLAFGLWVLLHGRPKTWIDFPWSEIMVSLAAIPLARLAAATFCRSFRRHTYYGLWLTLLSAVLASVPMGFAFRATNSTPASIRTTTPGYWIFIVTGCLVMFVVTLPCWLDKRRSAREG